MKTNLILLGGESLKNKAWIEQVRDGLQANFETEILYYDHWQVAEGKISFAVETGKLLQMTAGLTDFILFAKSAGSWMSLQAVAEGKVKPDKFVIVGPAWDWAINNGFKPEELINQVSVPVLIIDKSFDPSLAFADLQQMLADHKRPNLQLVEIPGDTHNYEDIVGLTKLVNEFVGQST